MRPGSVTNLLTGRGWGMLAVGAGALAAAQLLGRRDLLYLGVFMLTFPLLAAALLGWLRPRFDVERRFLPPVVSTGATATVELTVRALSAPDGPVRMRETLPARFGDSPSFRFPAAAAEPGDVSRYEYKFRSARRGIFDIGPIAAEFTDPFGLGRRQQNLGASSRLIVTPAPVDLPATALTGSAGLDGSVVTRVRANPSDDDVMTREYRHGDPMRRVHWASTARQGSLMVRREESVSAPYATLIMDQRAENFVRPGVQPAHSAEDTFEWAVTAAMSVAAHLLERGYTLRFLDTSAAPALLRSVSAPVPEDEEFSGMAGLHSLAEGLAALEPQPAQGASGHDAGTAVGRVARRVAAHRTYGPVVAILGSISTAEARALASAAVPGQPAYALLAVPAAARVTEALGVLRRAGWQAQSAGPAASLPVVWAGLDAPPPAIPAASGPDARNGDTFERARP